MLLLEPAITVADMILALEEEEIKELSALFDPCGNLIDGEKIQFAIDRATDDINGYFVTSGNCGKALIKLQSRNMTIQIARWLLDTVKARPHVVEDKNQAYERLKEYNVWDDERNCPLTSDQLEEILGEPLVAVDNNFRFGSSPRRWTEKSFRDYKKRLFDRRSASTTRRRGLEQHWSDDLPLE